MWAKVAAFGALVLAILLAVLRIEKKGEAAGAAKVDAANKQATIETVKKAQDAQATVTKQTPDKTKSDLEKFARD